MSLLPIDTVHGDHRIDRNVEPALIATQDFAPVPALLASAGAPVRQLQHRMLLGRPIVEAQLGDGKVRLLDARTAKPLPPVDGPAAALIARQAYRGETGSAPVVERIERLSTEYRGALPAWRASFPDTDGTRIYVAAETGRLTSVRTGTWRLYDFFWGLHIMDWTEHERFNTPWLNAFAAGDSCSPSPGQSCSSCAGPVDGAEKLKGSAREPRMPEWVGPHRRAHDGGVT
ncbi:hypothetical protein ACVOMT_21750 (plasmid) [Sphingomonas panni]|uniref:hypothetical protein n=1 Tax=Sphingomonas panni TaxID=237612 RepID=UPI003703B8A2